MCGTAGILSSGFFGVRLRLLVTNTSSTVPANNKQCHLPVMSVTNLPGSDKAVCITHGSQTFEKKTEYMFTHFDRIYEHDGQMDRHRATVRQHRPCLCIASCSKICSVRHSRNTLTWNLFILVFTQSKRNQLQQSYDQKNNIKRTNVYTIWFGGISSRYNHIFLILYRLVNGFWFCNRLNFAMPLH